MGENNEVGVYFDSLPLNATLLVRDAVTQRGTLSSHNDSRAYYPEMSPTSPLTCLLFFLTCLSLELIFGIITLYTVRKLQNQHIDFFSKSSTQLLPLLTYFLSSTKIKSHKQKLYEQKSMESGWFLRDSILSKVTQRHICHGVMQSSQMQSKTRVSGDQRRGQAADGHGV